MHTKPDFIIAGAAKAGTTVLAKWLADHPKVFMPEIKEPAFFAFDGQVPTPRSGPFDPDYFANIKTQWDDYLALFADAGSRISGEASPIYLSDRKAPGRIASRLPKCKIILVLRDPVERAFSQFMHHVRDGLETTFDFEHALQMEDTRRRDGWAWSFQYCHDGEYAAQLRRFYEVFPKDQVMVALYDDLCEKPQQLYGEVCRFLEIQPAHPDFSQRPNDTSNLATVPRWAAAERAIQHPSYAVTLAKRLTPKPVRRMLGLAIRRNNTLQRPVLTEGATALLAQSYAGEIAALETLLAQDLSAWKKFHTKGLPPVLQSVAPMPKPACSSSV